MPGKYKNPHLRLSTYIRVVERLFIYIESNKYRKRIEEKERDRRKKRRRRRRKRETARRNKRDELSGFTCCVPQQTRKELETIESTKFIYIYRDEARQLWLKYVFMRGESMGGERRIRDGEERERSSGPHAVTTLILSSFLW